MPLPEEIEELIAECEWTWTTLNNVNGYEVKGPNGNSIFLPAAGSFGIWGPNEELYLSVGEIGFYRGNFKQCQAYATELTRNQISASVNSESIIGNKTEGYSNPVYKNLSSEMKFENIVHGIFLSRPNRFIAKVLIPYVNSL